MYRAIVGLCGLILVVSAYADTRDGNWWVRQNETVKLAYVLGSIDRTMMTGSVDPDLKHEIVGTPAIGEIVSRLDALYYREDSRSVSVQGMLPLALMQIAQSAPSR